MCAVPRGIAKRFILFPCYCVLQPPLYYSIVSPYPTVAHQSQSLPPMLILPIFIHLAGFTFPRGEGLAIQCVPAYAMHSSAGDI